jgi:hypothetical protein
MSKGDAIRFVKGKYAGLAGWIDKNKKKKKNSFYRDVIVMLDDDSGEEKNTRVKISSYRKKAFADPRTFAEACVIQHPDIERTMIELAVMFAQCGIYQNDETLLLFDAELTLAWKLQQKLGSKARYRQVKFPLA